MGLLMGIFGDYSWLILVNNGELLVTGWWLGTMELICQDHLYQTISDWWFGTWIWNMNGWFCPSYMEQSSSQLTFIFFKMVKHILGIITPTEEVIFFRGAGIPFPAGKFPTNQWLMIVMVHSFVMVFIVVLMIILIIRFVYLWMAVLMTVNDDNIYDNDNNDGHYIMIINPFNDG